jgi:hyaluronate lyase
MRTNATRTYLWNDFDQLGANSADLTATYGRLRAMAMGYAVHGSTLEGNANLRGAIINGLDWMYTNYYNESVTEEYDNWYDWEIGSPLNLNDITVLLYGDLTAGQVANYMNAVDHFAPTLDLTAANEVWKATVVAVLGVIVKDNSKLADARQSLSDVFPYVTSGDGFYLDGSFVFHSIFPYNGGYGAQLIETIGPLMQLLKESSWEVTDALQANLYQWVYDSFQPLIYHGALMPMVQGRYFTRRGDDHLDGEDVIASILRLTQFAPPPHAAAFKSMIKSWLLDDTYRDFVQMQPPPFNVWAKEVMNDNGVAPLGELVGHYQFPRMDRVVHFRPGWGFGLAMSSSRIGNYESIQGENLRGWYTGDGMTYLYNADLGHYADNFWQTVSAYRLPGTTVDSQTRKAGSGQGYLSPNNWVGGASVQNLYGVAAMQLNAWNSTLSAKKSWFMFDEEIVCLGAGISSADSRTVETIVENRRLSAFGNNVFSVNGAAKPTSVGWSETISNISHAHLSGTVPGADIGYFFPQGGTLKALREARTGSLFDLNTAYGSKSQSLRNYLTLWFDHGVDPSNATYAYVLLPNKTAAQVAAYATTSNLVVLGNSTRAQGVRKISLGLTAVNFWTDGATGLGGLTVDKKSSVIVRNDGRFLEVGLADPTQTNTGSITLEINSAASALISADPAVSVVQLSPTIKLAVNVSGAGGGTLHARFLVGSPCAYSISPTNREHGYGAATNSVSVSTASGCDWTVFNTNSWITILPPTNGLRSGTVSYEVDANFSVNGRTGVVMIADQFLTLSQQPTPCIYSISPTNRVHGYGVTTNSVSVATTSGCNWTVVNTNSWITILSGASGTGGAILTYTVDANPNPVDRTGLVAIADQTFTILQRSVDCAYHIAPTNRVHGYGAASNTVSLTTSSSCSWSVVNTNDWITITSPTSGSGSTNVSYTVAPNLNPKDRAGLVTIADQVFNLTQRGFTNGPLAFQAIRSPGGGQLNLTLVGMPTGAWELQRSPDLIQWQKISELTNTSGVVEFTDTVPIDANPRFYRAVLRR